MRRAIELELIGVTLGAAQLCGTRDRSGTFPNKRKTHSPRVRVRAAPTFHSSRIELTFEVASQCLGRASLVEIV